jgi:ribosomal protein S21
METYSDAKFFIIKSYSEDDVHKSIKYNVWASTPNGNKKLDAAYQQAKENFNESSVFLLFSVNASGQFVGLAEMVGRVDFTKTLEHWQQDRWTGCFPLKWHIVKDVPNGLLKHIILENNENKPVTNCRDTHEVKLEQGLQVLKIFKDHVCKTSILDDFGFYDNREKMMKERKAKLQQSLKKVADVELPKAFDTEKKMLSEELGLQKLPEVEGVLSNDPSLEKADQKSDVKENGVALGDLRSPTEKLAGANGC